jgi:DNA-binding winged helix-turn-helix (wHTH) protein
MPERASREQFGEFELDRAAACLRRAGQEVDLPPRAFQVLTYLIDNRQRVVPKQELVDALWKDTFVTDDALVQAVTGLRRALGDDPDNPRYIRTRARVGYQFIAPVAEGAAAAEAATDSVWVAPIGRRRARRYFMAIQAGYLALYAATLIRLEFAAPVLGEHLVRRVGREQWAATLLVGLALTGVAVRLYLLTSVALDHPQTGRQYRRLFPALVVFDELWALAPLLWTGATGLVVALALVPVLAYAPLSQRTLIRSAYPLSGQGRAGP